MRVTSRQNPQFQRLRALVVSRGSNAPQFVIEGPKLIGEALAASLRVSEVVLDPESRQGRAWLDNRPPGSTDVSVVEMSTPLLSSLSALETAPGIMAVVERPKARAERDGKAFILILDRVQDPGNVGTLFRTAEATGVTEVWLLAGSADPFGPKALRASAGSAFRVRFEGDLTSEAVLARLRDGRVPLVATTAAPNTPSIFDQSLSPPIALALGSEGQGLCSELLDGAKQRVRIPQAAAVESLNVAASGAVALFEIARRNGSLR